MTTLSKRYRLILQLRDDKGKTFEEIGQVLKVSRQRVYQMYARAKKREKARSRATPKSSSPVSSLLSVQE